MWEKLKAILRLGLDRGGASPQQRKAWTLREGKLVPVDQVFEAWTSGNLPQMLEVLGCKTNLVDRHYLLMGIVNETYRLRSESGMAQKCLEVAQIHLDEFPEIARALRRDSDGVLPQVTTFQHYATLLTERGEFDAAVRVCETAISHGLDDGTKGGYPGRIQRIKKKASQRSL